MPIGTMAPWTRLVCADPAATPRDQAGDDAARRGVHRAPAPEREAQECRPAAQPRELLVEDPKPSHGEAFVDWAVGVGVIDRPREHGRRDEVRVAARQARVVESSRRGRGGAELVHQDVSRTEELLELRLPVGGGEVEGNTALAAIPGAET
jgi:hypothetical protein